MRRSSRVAYQNPWLAFEVHEIVHPNGVAGEHGLVVVPGASGVIVLDGDDVVLTEQMRFAVDRVMVEIVKGGADEGETTQACAERELREELGLVAARWTPLGPAYEVPSILTAPVELYLARDVRPVAAAPDAVETIRARRMPFTQALELALGGGIDDGVTIAALVRAAVAVGRMTLSS